MSLGMMDDLNIWIKTMEFIWQADAVLLGFHFADRALKQTRLYCLSLHGGISHHYNNMSLKMLWHALRTSLSPSTVCQNFVGIVIISTASWLTEAHCRGYAERV